MSDRSGARAAYRRLRQWRWPRNYPIAQFPNPPLIIGLVALGLRYLASGTWADALGAIGYAFIAIWAYLELTAGVNLFRRVLGLAGLAYVVFAIVQRFGG
ncbi:MAG: hypothetical protein FJW99_07565 [Actinobacteria bacterium]|nr:hypothetical protein [Actinomycetota bacterium]